MKPEQNSPRPPKGGGGYRSYPPEDLGEPTYLIDMPPGGSVVSSSWHPPPKESPKSPSPSADPE